jgi:hypothetical protein
MGCDGAIAISDNLGKCLCQHFDLGCCQVLSRQKDMLIKWHVVSLLLPIADAAPCRRPSGFRPNDNAGAQTPAESKCAYG